MRLIAQRVSSASVTVNGEVCASIGCGMVVLVGIAATDDPVTAVEWGVRKLLGLRLWEDESGKA
jgi:D-tyrosyl-tRNA(Tyr) deacylase